MYCNKNLNRRDFLKRTGHLAGGILMYSSAPNFFLRENIKNRPNVLFIMSDEMRGDALSCLGSPNARTPNLDEMARQGVIFENAFCNNPVCTPSRISTFTGLYPHQHGTLNNEGPYLKTTKNTLIELFKKNGYKLGFIGKNHMIELDKPTLDKYFDYYKFVDRENFREYSKYVPAFWHVDTYRPSEECFTTTHTNEGIEFINKTDVPFFLFVSYHDPHPPYMAPSEYSSQFSSKEMILPEYIPALNLSSRLHNDYLAMNLDKIKYSDLTETFRYYYASIFYIDYNVGRFIDALKKKGILENTIVIFTSDHGDFMGEHRMVRKGYFLYDALLHIPMIWYCPGLIKNSFRVKNIVESVDLLPTITDFLGIDIPLLLPGRSLKPILQGKAEIDEEHFAFASAIDNGEIDFALNRKIIPKEDKILPIQSQEMKNFPNKIKTASIRNLNWRFIKTQDYPSELYKMDKGWIERENLAQKKEYANLVASFEKKIEEIWPDK